MPGSFNINQNYSDFKIVPIFPQAPSFAFVRLVMTAVLSDPDSTKLMAASILGSFVNDLNLFSSIRAEASDIVISFNSLSFSSSLLMIR